MCCILVCCNGQRGDYRHGTNQPYENHRVPPHCASSVCPAPVCVHAFGHAFYPVSMQEESSRLSYFLFHASPSLQCATTNASIFTLLTKHWFLYTVGYYRDFFPIHFLSFHFDHKESYCLSSHQSAKETLSCIHAPNSIQRSIASSNNSGSIHSLSRQGDPHETHVIPFSPPSLSFQHSNHHSSSLSYLS